MAEQKAKRASTKRKTAVAHAQADSPPEVSQAVRDVTEKPVPTAEPTAPVKPGPEAEKPPEQLQQWVFTVNTATGALVRVERIEPSGERQEVTLSEFAALVGYGGLYSAYYQGLADAAQSSESPEFQAYLQGMAAASTSVG